MIFFFSFNFVTARGMKYEWELATKLLSPARQRQISIHEFLIILRLELILKCTKDSRHTWMRSNQPS